MAEQQMTKVKKTRMANLDALRCLAMIMVVILHYLGKGNIFPSPRQTEAFTGVQTSACILEMFCIVAVNLYMLLSGYLMHRSSFKLSRLIELYLQVWVYSVGIGVLMYFWGGRWGIPHSVDKYSTDYFLYLLLPISKEHYWFMSAYFYFYVLFPILGMAIRQMNQKQYRLVLGLCIGVWCVIKSVLPISLNLDQAGYDVIWYICVFLTGAYLAKFQPSYLQKKWLGYVLYWGGVLAALVEFTAIRFVYVRTGSLSWITNTPYDYNHIFVYLASIGLFLIALQWKLSGERGFGKWIVAIAPYSLGVYLLHENIGIRYSWEHFLNAEFVNRPWKVLVYSMLAGVIIFLLGIFVDFVRSKIMVFLHQVLQKIAPYRKICHAVERADELFQKKEV